MSRNNAYLGISLSSPICSPAIMKGYIAWANIHCSSFAFLIGDYIAAFTYSALQGVSLAQAQVWSDKRGGEIYRMLSPNISKLRIPSKIFRWKDFFYSKRYWILVDEFKRIYSADRKFREDVRTQIWKNLGSSIDKRGICRTTDCGHKECGKLELYLIHELAGLILMSEYSGYELEIYPGKDLFLLNNVYREVYSNSHLLRLANSRRQFLELKINI